MMLSEMASVQEVRRAMESGNDPILVQEWDSQRFHRRVLELEAQGYTTRLDSYRITSDMEPDTGRVRLRYSIELLKETGEQDPS